MDNNTLKFLVSLVAICVPTICADEHFICKNVQNIFSETNQGVSTHASSNQGPPGKRGPQGYRGPRGLSGIPATVDYETISSMIERKVEQELEKNYPSIAELQRNITAMQRMQAVKQCSDGGGFPFQRMCYFSDVSKSSYSDAMQKCARNQSFLAEIHTRQQQIALQNFFHGQISSTTYYIMWIGMTYRKSDRNLVFRSGEVLPADRFIWHSNRPTGNNGNKMTIEFVYDSHSTEGLLEVHSGNYGVICERPLSFVP